MPGTIYILAGHTPDPSRGKYDPGAVGNGLKEADVVNELCDAVITHFKAWGIAYKTDNDAASLSQVLEAIELGTDDILVDLHCNAGPPAATGCEVIVPERSTQKERDCAQAILNAITGLTGLKSRGVKPETATARKKLAVMREAGTNILIELFFISNPADIARYEPRKADIAYNIANISRRYAGWVLKGDGDTTKPVG